MNTPKPDEIIRAVLEVFAIDRIELDSSDRAPLLVVAREVCASALRARGTLSWPKIARIMNRSNHTTAITAADRFRKRAGVRMNWLCGEPTRSEVMSWVMDRAAGGPVRVVETKAAQGPPQRSSPRRVVHRRYTSAEWARGEDMRPRLSA